MAKHATFNVLIVPRAKRNAKQQSEKLYARITVGGERLEISLGRDVSSGLFNPKSQWCPGKTKEARLTNEFITIVKSDLNEIRKELLVEGKEVTAGFIKARYKGLPDPDEIKNPTLLELYDEHNRKFKELIGTKYHSASTYNRHLTAYSHVKEYIHKTYKKSDLSLEQIDFKFLSNYEHYFKATRNCNHNSTMKYIKNLGKIIRSAVAEGYITINPFNKFKLSYESVHRTILSQKEVNKMVKLEIEEDRLDRVRDLFVFCIYTGVAFIDVHELKMKHIMKDDNRPD